MGMMFVPVASSRNVVPRWLANETTNLNAFAILCCLIAYTL